MKRETVSLIIRYATIALMVIAAIFEILIISKGDETVATTASLQDSLIGPFLSLSYVSVLIPAALALIFPIVHLLDNPKSAKGILIGVGALIVVVGLAYAISPSTVESSFPQGTTEGTSKWVSTGLNTFLFLSIIAVGSIVYTEVSRLFK